MNEKRVQEVIEIEKQAQELLAAASRDAERIPADAESEARQLAEKVRAAAREEARKLLEQARAQDQAGQIISKAQEKMGELDKLAAKNLEKAISYVVARVVGEA
ncbi:MAG TPA: hypothetical protein VIU38_13760 [Anaerolineales bacterium]